LFGTFVRHHPCRRCWQTLEGLQQVEDLAMTNEIASDMRISNWTLATGTRAGERHVYPDTRHELARPPAPNGRL
jgi:hypothetical protein